MAIKVGMVSLGCSKNQVDGEMLLSLIQEGGFELCADPARCDVVLINTCGFIESAKQESIETILEFCQLKKKHKLKAVVVTGCLAERYREELAREIPETDVVLGIGSNAGIVEAIHSALEGKRVLRFGEKTDLPLEGGRVLANQPFFAYLKVAEGCDNRCAYCAIPGIRGRFRSRKMEDVVAQAKQLAKQGVVELNVVAQDTTRYGDDLYGKYMLPELVTELCKIDEVRWVRLLYCYPDRITDELLDVMAREPKVVKYMDIPIQHCSSSVLKAMNRRGSRESLTALMQRVRDKVPGVVLRTTLITGFPGETEENFVELCEFVKEVRFERLGCFTYSQEEDTPAAEMENQVEEELKARRAELIMTEQMDIARQIGEKLIGQTLTVLVEGYDFENQFYYGRSYMDAPDIDTKVYFSAARKVAEGEMVPVVVEDVFDYDLVGKMA